MSGVCQGFTSQRCFRCIYACSGRGCCISMCFRRCYCCCMLTLLQIAAVHADHAAYASALRFGCMHRLCVYQAFPVLYLKATPSLRGMGRLWSIQGLPSTMPDSMANTPHGVDSTLLLLFFLKANVCCCRDNAIGLVTACVPSLTHAGKREALTAAADHILSKGTTRHFTCQIHCCCLQLATQSAAVANSKMGTCLCYVAHVLLH